MVTLVSPTLGRHFGQLLGRFLENHRDPLKRISWLLLADLSGSSIGLGSNLSIKNFESRFVECPDFYELDLRSHRKVCDHPWPSRTYGLSQGLVAY